jgi:hypothetical protein
MEVRGLVTGVGANAPEVISLALLDQWLKHRCVLIIGTAVHSFRKR